MYVQTLTNIFPRSLMALNILLTPRNHFLVPSIPPLQPSAVPGLFTFEFFLPMFNILLDNSLAKASVQLLLKTSQSFLFPPWYYFYLFSMSKLAEGSALCLSFITPSSAQNHTSYLFVPFHTALQSKWEAPRLYFLHLAFFWKPIVFTFPLSQSQIYVLSPAFPLCDQ